MAYYKVKNVLLHDGLKVNKSAKEHLASDDNGIIKYGDYVTIGDLMLNLGKDTFVSANEKETSPYTLNYSNGSFNISDGNKILIDNIEISQPPKSTKQDFITKSGKKRAITEYNNLHGDRDRIQPVSGCSNDCRFCDLCGLTYEEKDVDDLVTAYEIVNKQNPGIIKNILVSGGTPRENSSSYEYMNEVYKRFGEISKEKRLQLRHYACSKRIIY